VNPDHVYVNVLTSKKRLVATEQQDKAVTITKSSRPPRQQGFALALNDFHKASATL
jgi:hypothetical protein